MNESTAAADNTNTDLDGLSELVPELPRRRTKDSNVPDLHDLQIRDDDDDDDDNSNIVHASESTMLHHKSKDLDDVSRMVAIEDDEDEEDDDEEEEEDVHDNQDDDRNQSSTSNVNINNNNNNNASHEYEYDPNRAIKGGIATSGDSQRNLQGGKPPSMGGDSDTALPLEDLPEDSAATEFLNRNANSNNNSNSNPQNDAVSLSTATQTHEMRMPMYLPSFKPATGCTNASDFIVRCFVARLRSGITIVKHGRSRWCKSRLRILHIHNDGRSLSWKPAEGEPHSSKRPPKLDLAQCNEVRHAWSPDPHNPMYTGTPILRQKCEAANAHKSFALVFKQRTVDVTAVTADQCKVLMEGFSALCFRLQVANLAGRNNNNNNNNTSSSATASRPMPEEDGVSTTASNTLTNKSSSVLNNNNNNNNHAAAAVAINTNAQG